MARITRPIKTVAFVATAALGLSACVGVEDLAEEAIERSIEAENGGDVEVDFDFDGDDGGTFTVEGPDGEVVTFGVDENGDGQFSVEGTDDGDFTAQIDSDDDGDVTIQTEDGVLAYDTGSEVPAEWTLPVPDGVVEGSSVVDLGGEGVIMSLELRTGASPEDAVAAYGAALEAQGWTVQGTFSEPGSSYAGYLNGEDQMAISADASSGETAFSLLYTSVTG